MAISGFVMSMLNRAGLFHTVRRAAAIEFKRHSSSLGGKVAIVTASTKGIGYAIARRLGQDGAKVMISSRKQDNVDKTLTSLKDEGLQVSGMVCHVGKDKDRKQLIAKTVADFGKIDILISNAGINPAFGSIMMDVTEGIWDKIFDINVKCTFLLIKECVPHMTKNAAITLVSSIAGYNPRMGIGAYSVSKTALLGLTKALATELAPDIRVNAISPGLIETNFGQAVLMSKDMKNKILESVPLQRFGKVEDCAGLASFLSSDDAAYLTGENIVVTGGMPSHL